MTNVQNSDLCRYKKRECEQIISNFFEMESNPRFRFYFKLPMWFFTSKETSFIVDPSSINLKRTFWFANEAKKVGRTDGTNP